MTDDRVVIRLPGIPQGKGRPRFDRRSGHTYTPAKTASYEGALRWAAAAEMAGRTPLAGALIVDITASMPIPPSWSKRKRDDARDGRIYPTSVPDCDNLMKVLDGLNGIIWQDDRQIVHATIRKVYSDVPGFTVVVDPMPEVPA